jgi:predicted AAA+ superfamily ATPase
LNLENKSILAEIDENPLNVLKFLPGSSGRVIVLVDEVQYLSDPSNFLKLLYDEHVVEIKIIASGSSSFYLDSQFRDSLAGRKRIFNLYTCAFDEYLEISGKTELKNEMKRIISNPETKSTQIDYLQIEWEKYMIYGGYPAVVAEPENTEKINILREIRDSYVKRDILESGVSNENVFYHLFRLLASQTGQLVNINELSATLKIKHETLNKYLAVMQKSFHINLPRPFYQNLRKELVKMPKVYFLDTGMRNCLLNNFHPIALRHDKGELWENSVFRLLVDKYGADEIRFWRTSSGNELDFVLNSIQEPLAFEAKWEMKHNISSKYKKFCKTYPGIPLRFMWMAPFNEDFFRRQELFQNTMKS